MAIKNMELAELQQTRGEFHKDRHVPGLSLEVISIVQLGVYFFVIPCNPRNVRGIL